MSGTAGATTLQDFLISVRYTVDSASQNNFLKGLERAALGTKGLAVELAGLVTGLFALSDALAKAGENFYWMSQRLGSSVQDIRSAAFAMSNLGMSTDEAKQSMEQFGQWMRSTGPAALSFLRMWGITSTNAVDALQEAALKFHNMGVRPELQGTQQYAVALAASKAIPGLTEQMIRLADQEQRFIDLRKETYRSIGLNVAAEDAWSKKSMEVATAFRSIHMEWTALKDAFALKFNTGMLPILHQLFDSIKRMMPTINMLLQAFAQILITVLSAISGAIDIISHLVAGFQQIFDLLGKLPHHLELAQAAFLAFGLVLLRSPIGMVIAGLTTLMLLLDDFATYERGGTSHWNWAWADKLSDWSVCIAGIKVDMWGIAAAVAAIAVSMAAIATSMALIRVGGGLRTALLGAGASLGAGGVPAPAAPGAGGAGWIASGFGLGIGALISSWIKSELDEGTDWLRDKLFGAGHSAEVEKAHEEGAKQFWDAVYESLGIKSAHATTEAPPAIGGAGAGGAAGAVSGTGGAGAGTGGTAGAGALGGTPLASLITRGESGAAGGYNAVNRGAAGGGRSGTEDLENKTVAEVMRDQAEHKYNAAGRYQIIASTMIEAFNKMHLTGAEKFDRGMQDRIFSEFLAGSKRPAVRDYLSGQSNDLHAALLGVSKEWASVANPDTGLSSYPPQRATISVADMTAALNATRQIMVAQQQPSTPAAPQGTRPTTPAAPQGAQGSGMIAGLRDWSRGTFFAHPANAAEVNRAARPGATLPAGAGAGGAGAGAGGKALTVNQQTTVNVAPGPDAAATAAHVASAQGRVNEQLVRNSSGILR